MTMNLPLAVAILASVEERNPVAFSNLLQALPHPLQLALRRLWDDRFQHLVSIVSPLIEFHLFTI